MATVPFSQYYQLLKTYLQPFKKQITMLSLLIVTRIAIQLYYPQIVSEYLDSISEKTIDELQYLAIIYIAIAVISQIIFVVIEYFSQSIAWGSTNALREDLLQHTVKLDMTFHNEYKSGQMIERVDGDVNALSNFFSQLTIQLMANILLILAIIVLMFFVKVTFGLAFIGFILIATLVIKQVRHIAVPYFKKHREKAMELFGYIEERISGTEDIRAIGAIPGVMQGYHKHESAKFHAMRKAILFSRIVSIAFNMLLGTAIALGFAIATPLYLNNEISIGTYFIIYYYTGLLVQPIFQILRQMQNLQEADASIERIEELFEIETKIEDKGTIEIKEDLAITFENINFSYRSGIPVLNSLSFDLKQGETLGLIGRTGSGKTTITRLLYRLYELNDGDIKLNNTSIKDIALGSLRKNIGMVTQEVQLYQTTLRNNVTFFDPNISDDDIVKVINDVGLASWYSKLDKGLDTIISSDETGVSAGEAQLLAVTRIFLTDPKLVILDEASSRLDPLTEKKLDEAISKLTETKTTIIVAHRLSTLKNVDKILLIEDGNLKEFDYRSKLEQDENSSYYKLLRTGIEDVLK